MNFITDSLSGTSIFGQDCAAPHLTSLLSSIAHLAPGHAKAMHTPEVVRCQESEFIEFGEEMLCHTRNNDEPLSLLIFELDDLREFRDVFGRRLMRMVLAQTTAALRRVANSRSLAAWTAPTRFSMVVPGETGGQLAAALAAKLGPACCIEFESGGDEILLVPEFRVETIGDTGSLQQAYDAACRNMTRTRIDRQRHRHHMTRERESYSRPVPLDSTMSPMQPKCPEDFAAYAPMPATIPVPFGLRA